MIFRYNFPAILWALFILVATLTPGKFIPATNLVQFSIDKLAHVFIFFVLAYLMMRGLKKQYSSLFLRHYALSICIIFGLSYGLLTEIFQGFIPGRMFEWADAFADSFGSLTGCLIFIFFTKPKN